jgi:hypothetical protein
MKKIIAISCISMIVAPISGFAATGSATFSGSVDNICVITAGAAGRIVPNADYTNLSSTNPGGYASQVTALATGNIFSISTDVPAGITADNKSSSYSLSGATNKAITDGTSASPLTSGLTNVSVDLSATRTSGVFTSGTYNGVVTVRCE